MNIKFETNVRILGFYTSTLIVRAVFDCVRPECWFSIRSWSFFWSVWEQMTVNSWSRQQQTSFNQMAWHLECLFENIDKRKWPKDCWTFARMVERKGAGESEWWDFELSRTYKAKVRKDRTVNIGLQTKITSKLTKQVWQIDTSFSYLNPIKLIA